MATKQEKANDQLIVVGASAGGIEALSTLVATLPADLAVPIVIAQHLDPARPSRLAEILGRRSTVPVHLVENRTRLNKGIFVVPAHHHVEINEHEIRLINSSSSRPQPSIDRLMQSAADTFHENLLAVILTGIGSDGSIGARAVKAAGGTVIIQNPDTARFPSMPRSLAPTSVDIVADLENIGPMLKELSEHTTSRHDGEKSSVAAILEYLRQNHGIDFSTYKAPTIIRRLQRRMVATGLDSIAEYRRRIEEDPEESVRLISSFLIKVTEFFRDADLFEHLREQLIPKLIEDARGRGNEIRIWSAGCATGEEPFSIGILLCEALGDAIDNFSIRIFATDLDPDAVAFARRGVYPAPALEGVSPEIVDRYFTKTDNEYEIKKKIRSLAIFGQHDLGHRAPFPRVDLALCRNVLIYFTADRQMQALERLAFSIRDGGYLVLGKSESPGGTSTYFTEINSRLRIYRREGSQRAVPQAIFDGETQAPRYGGLTARYAATSGAHNGPGPQGQACEIKTFQVNYSPRCPSVSWSSTVNTTYWPSTQRLEACSESTAERSEPTLSTWPRTFPQKRCAP